MKGMRVAAMSVVLLLTLLSVTGSFMSTFDYVAQDRAHIAAAPSAQHWLGRDSLGRDRTSRLLYGTRVSLLLAPAAAAVSILLAFAIGATPGFLGGLPEQVARTMIDLVLSIPWLFLLLILRALLPLNTSPGTSVTITFL